LKLVDSSRPSDFIALFAVGVKLSFSSSDETSLAVSAIPATGNGPQLGYLHVLDGNVPALGRPEADFGYEL
jgi:hypothetical protein